MAERNMEKRQELFPAWASGIWDWFRGAAVFFTSLLIVIYLVSSGYSHIISEYFSPVDTKDATPVSIVVEKGWSVSKIASKLQELKLIRNSGVFKYYVDFTDRSGKLQSGEYVLNRSMTIDQIIEKLMAGDGKPKTATFTVYEGNTVENMAAILVNKGILANAKTFLSLCKSGELFTDYTLVADLLGGGRISERKYALEGYLFPASYDIYVNASEETIIRKMLAKSSSVLNNYDYISRAQELGMSMDEVLTLASMIEKEGKTDDFAKVSAVFHNRLAQGMRLGSDATVHYATGKNNLKILDVDKNVGSPFNTYLYDGLPPGPICNPSEAAISAALYPDSVYLSEGYLYFCTAEPESGKLHFSKTLEEHNAAVAEYEPLWKEYDEKQSQG